MSELDFSENAPRHQDRDRGFLPNLGQRFDSIEDDGARHQRGQNHCRQIEGVERQLMSRFVAEPMNLVERPDHVDRRTAAGDQDGLFAEAASPGVEKAGSRTGSSGQSNRLPPTLTTASAGRVTPDCPPRAGGSQIFVTSRDRREIVPRPE